MKEIKEEQYKVYKKKRTNILNKRLTAYAAEWMHQAKNKKKHQNDIITKKKYNKSNKKRQIDKK